MFKLYEKAWDAAFKYVLTNKEFSYEDIVNYVHKEAGITRFAPCRTIKDWLCDLERIGFVKEKAPGKFISYLACKKRIE